MNKNIRNIRSNILNLTFKAKSSHIGSCLSIVEILFALYFGVLKKKDRFILSKGHAALALYSTLFEKKLKFKTNKENNKVYVLMSDGEMNEGTTWESLLFANHHKLDNLNIIIDYNKIQSMDFVSKVIKIEPLKKKLQSFGCKVFEVNGHSVKQISKCLKKKTKDKIKVIIANTIKGKGVSFMENNNLWHYKNPNEIQLKKALKEIELKYA